MTRLLATTALVTFMAMPLAAQQAGEAQTQTQSTQMQSETQLSADVMIQASDLIGRRLYILRDGEQAGDMQRSQPAQTTEQTTTQDSAGVTTTTTGDQATVGQQDQQVAEDQTGAQVTEGQQDQQMAEGQTGAPVTEGQQDQQMAEGQTGAQVTEGQQDQQMAEGQTGAQVTQGQQDQQMADYSQGVAEPQDNWAMAGEIDDVLLSQDGQVQALVIDSGGFLGMNERTRQIDIQDVRFVPDTNDEGRFFVLYTGDRQMFEQSQAFDEASLQETGQQRGTQVWGDEIRRDQSDVAFTSLTADDLVGTSVYGANDDWVGEISELAVTEDGQISAVIVDVGGFLGIGARSVALDMEQIQLRRTEGGLFTDDLRAYVNATEEELEALPEWDEDAG
jgi:hypothetical protein